MGELLDIKDFKKVGVKRSRGYCENMGEVLDIKDFKRVNVKRFEVHYYVGYDKPVGLLEDFVKVSDLLLCGNSCLRCDYGDCDVSLTDFDERESVYVNIAYNGTSFEISEEHPRGGEISDLFVKHLAEREVPHSLLGKESLLSREIVYDSRGED